MTSDQAADTLARRLDDVAETFASLGDDDAMKLELLLDFARQLPALPADLEERRQHGDGLVPQCMTPVHLWIRTDEHHRMTVHAWSAPQSPTIAGLLCIIVEASAGRPASEASMLPADLVGILGLQKVIRMNRLVGLSAMIERIRLTAQEHA